MPNRKSPSKNLRNLKRLIIFLQSKITPGPQLQDLSICPGPSFSVPPEAPALPSSITSNAELVQPLAGQDPDQTIIDQTQPDLAPDPDFLTKEMFLEIMKDFKEPLFKDDAFKSFFKPP